MVADGVAFALHMEELEEDLQLATPDERRRIALHAASEVGVTDIPDEERHGAAASFVATTVDTRSAEFAEQSRRALARSLATDERRAEVREAVAENFAGASAQLPLLAAAVDELLGEPIPEDAGDDDLWVGAVFGPAALEL